MSNYFYHPLGDYAQNYIDGNAPFGALPHTRQDHGFSKIDFGVGGGVKVYSMTDGIITSAGNLGISDNISKYGCVVKTSDTGYSRMQAKLQGGTASDYPIYFTYIELDEIDSKIKVGESISQGQYIGLTNNEYAGSNLHFDIQPYDRYNTIETPQKAQQWKGAISLGQYDAYGDKGSNYKLLEHLDDNFKYENGGIKDYTNKMIGVKGSDGKYYPPSSSGMAVMNNTGANEGNLDPSLEIGRWYSQLFMMQTPIKIEGKKTNLPAGWHPKDDWSDGIEGYFSNGVYTFPVYLQGRGPWASQRFWGGTFATSACSVTAAAIIASGITGNTVLPSDIASAYTSITGSKPYPNFGYSNNLGPLVEYCGGKTLGRLSSFSEILNHLSQKHPVELNMSTRSWWGNNYRTSQGHLITLLDYDKDNGKVFLGDPNPAHPSGWFDWKPFENNWNGYAEAFE